MCLIAVLCQDYDDGNLEPEPTLDPNGDGDPEIPGEIIIYYVVKSMLTFWGSFLCLDQNSYFISLLLYFPFFYF